jgi:branched-chain amino acid transport system substrate-binding protein
MRRSSFHLAAGLLTVALLTAACGGGGSSSTKPSTSSSGGSKAIAGKAAGNAIVVGGIQDGNYDGIDTGFKARIARFNARGGVAGRTIDFIGELNDGDSLSGDLSTAQTLVLKDHVFAVAPIAAETLSPSSAELFAQNSTPFIGWGIIPAFCGNDWGFPVSGCAASSQWQNSSAYTQAIRAIGKAPKTTRVAVIGSDNTGGKVGTANIVTVNSKLGADVVYGQASVSQSTTDYTPYVQALLAANPDIVELTMRFQSAVGLTAALRQAGYKGAIWNPTAYVPGLFAAQPQLARALTGSLVLASFPPAEQNSAAAAAMESDLKAVGAPAAFSLGEAVGWWSAEEFIQELQATAARGPITQANFEKVINAGWTIKPLTGGITGLSFPADHAKDPGCFGTLQANGASYAIKEPYLCDPAAEMSVTGG